MMEKFNIRARTHTHTVRSIAREDDKEKRILAER